MRAGSKVCVCEQRVQYTHTSVESRMDTSDLQGVALKAFSFGKQLVKQVILQ